MESSMPGPLRILLVSAREDMRDEAEEALASMADPHEIAWASQPDVALGRAEELLPDIVLVDHELAGVSVPLLIKELSAVAPDAAIISLVEAHAVKEASRAVLAGARAFLFKPLHGDDLVTSVQEILSQRQPVEWQSGNRRRASGRVIAFCAPGGGTGRTTLAINTAISLHMASKKPLVLIDADYASPAVDVALNLHSERTIADLLPRLSRLDEDFLSAVLAEHVSGIHVLLAPPPARPLIPITQAGIQQVLVLLKRMFPWVIVDLGLVQDERSYAFLDSADRIVISVLPEVVGLRNARVMLDELHRHAHTREKIWLLINRATMTGGITARDIERQLHTSVRYRIPDDQPLATHSINRGVPMVISHRRGAVVRAFRGLALQMLEELPAMVEIPERQCSVTPWVLEDRSSEVSFRAGSTQAPVRPG